MALSFQSLRSAELHFDPGDRFWVGGLGGVSVLQLASGIELDGANGGDLVAGAGGEEHH